MLGRKVSYQNISMKMFSKALVAMGFPIRPHSQLRYYVDEFRRGAFEVGSTNNVILDIGGRPPEDFETIVRRYVAADPRTKRTLGNKFRAIIGFMKILVSRAPDLDKYEQAQGHPLLREPKFARDAAPWTATHDVPNAFDVEPESVVNSRPALKMPAA